MMKRKRLLQAPLLALLAVVVLVGLASIDTADAFRLKLGNDATLDVDTRVSYAAGWRLKHPDDSLINDLNGNDGELNFDETGDWINNRWSAVADIDLHYKDYGIFVRPKTFFDTVYDKGRFNKHTKQRHRDTTEILDAYAYGTTNLGGHRAELRVGRQSVSWGESIYLQNSVSSAMSPIDVTASHVPGVALKEIYLPVGQVFGQIDLTSELTLAGYYQWEWEKNRLDERGSYFSYKDLLDDAGRSIWVPTVSGLPMADMDRIDDGSNDDSGHWGVALHYTAPESLNNTEIGLYYIYYDEHMPMVCGHPMTGTINAPGGSWAGINPALAPYDYVDSYGYNIKYGKDIKLYGVSVSTVFFDTNFAAEVSYRKDLPVQVVDTNPGNLFGFAYKDVDALQAQISTIIITGPTMLWDDLTVMGECGFNRIYNRGGAELYNDRFAWGFTVTGSFAYYNVLPQIDVTIPVALKMNPNGDSSVTGTFGEDDDSYSVGISFLFRREFSIGLNYTDYFHDADKNPLADRDFISLSASYTF